MDATAVRMPVDGQSLDGVLVIPDGAAGLVVFAHGSGSSRFSPRNRAVARVLQDAGFATLLFDLLGEDESVQDERTAQHRFDIALLARRLVQVLHWLESQDVTKALPVGLFGASTGAAAALVAAAEVPQVLAVVSRGGRPDLAGEALPHVTAATLLVVGELDESVIGLNQQAAARLRCQHRLVLVPGASHLFEEPGTLEIVARLTADWFALHLRLRDVAF